MNFKVVFYTYLYYFFPCLVWGSLFFGFYGVYQLCYYLDMVDYGIIYSVHAILAVIFIVFLVKSLKSFYGVRVNHKRVNQFHDFLFSLKCSFGIFGEQGVGKSLMMTYIIMTLCPQKFLDLQYEYYKDLPIKEKLLDQAKSGDLFSWKLHKSRGESLDFYVRNLNEFIPCVYAFKEQTITQSGRKSYELKKEHFTMDERLPENNMLACDEFGDRFNNTARRKDLSKSTLSDNELRERLAIENTFKMASTHRQVTNGFLVLADQRKGDISIAFKGTCSKKWYLVSLEERYLAVRVLKWKDRVKDKIRYYGNAIEHPELLSKMTKKPLEKLQKKLNKYTKIDKRLSKIERKIGFFKIGYIEENGSEEVATVDKKDIKYISIPRNLGYQFNSRGYLLTDPTIEKTLRT